MDQMSAQPSFKLEKLAGKFLIFNLGYETYGMPVMRIREIIRATQVTPMPEVPPHIKGVINLRGKIIPVVDLRARFGLVEIEASEHRCIIVVPVRGVSSSEILIGLLVDDVHEVLSIAPAQIEEAPEFGCSIRSASVLGLAKLKTKVVILLNIDQALTWNSAQTAQVTSAEVSIACNA